MGASPSNEENKEETTITKEDNKNEVVYNQKGMKVINIHGETVMISLAATVIMIFFLLALYKFMERRGCWKKRRTPAPECPDCQTTNMPMTNLRVAAPTTSSPRRVMMTAEGPPEKWSSSWFPSGWPALRTPSMPPRYSKEYRKERETEDQRRQHEPSQQEIKEQEQNTGHPGDWDGIQKEP